MREGFIKLHRSMLDWEWYDDVNVLAVFVHCLLKANYDDDTWRGAKLPKGAFATSPQKIAAALNLTRQQVRTALEKLRSTNEITTQAHGNFTVISIVKWGDYQSKKPESNQQSTTEQPQNTIEPNQEIPPIITTDKEGKKKEEKKIEIGEVNSPPKPAKKKTSRGSRLPENFALTQERGEYAEQKGLTPDEIFEEFEKFTLYWKSETGANAAKADWNAAWQRWVLNAVGYKRERERKNGR